MLPTIKFLSLSKSGILHPGGRNRLVLVFGSINSDIIEQSTGKRPRFIFVALEKSAPYGIAVYEIDQESVENARLDYLDDLNRWITCRREGVYPGYDTEIQTLML